MKNSWKYGVVSAGVVCILSTATHAQTGEPATAGAQAASSMDIIVTAQRRSERLVDVPISLTAVTGDSLAVAGVNMTQQLGQVVPGLRLDLSGGFSQPTLRGVGSSVAGPGLSASVATYLDGVYRPSQLSSNFELADIEQIQVLKGPQGTLFGRNATGGAIVVTTADPTFEPTVRGKLSYGRFNEVRTSVVASAGLTDKLAFGVAGLYHRSDGFVRNIYTGKRADKMENWTVRAKLLFEPSDTLSFLLQYEHVDINDDAPNAYNAYRGRAAANDPAVVGMFRPGQTSVPIPTERGIVSLNAPTAYRVKNNNFILRTRADFGAVDMTSYTAYLHENTVLQQDYDASELPLFQSRFTPKDRTFSQELNFSSKPGGSLDWVAGLFYFHDKATYPEYNAIFYGAPPFNVFDIGVTTRWRHRRTGRFWLEEGSRTQGLAEWPFTPR